jgi:hypothetical protein
MYNSDKNDCDILMDDLSTFGKSLERSIDTMTSNHTTKTAIAGSLFGIGKSLTKLAWDAGKCTIKHTPKAIATVSEAKQEFIEASAEEYYTFKKEMLEEELSNDLARIARKSNILA